MPVVAANTWGISGSGFLWLYGLLSVGWFLMCLLLRRYLLRSKETGGGAVSEYELATLNGGRRLAVIAATAKLRSLHVLGPGEEPHSLRTSGGLRSHADPLEQAVFDAVERESGIAIRKLRQQDAVVDATGGLVRSLTDRGLMLTPRAAIQLRWLWVSGLPVLALGLARVIAGTHNHKPTDDLSVMVTCVVLAIVWLAFSRRGRLTPAGRRKLEDQRHARRVWRTSPRRVAPSLAVALFGSSALWVIDPAFAAAWSAPREKAAVWIGTFAGSGSGGGAGGGCGGGGGGCGG
jgi:uncharacterized protein (TIGR04222 family)